MIHTERTFTMPRGNKIEVEIEVEVSGSWAPIVTVEAIRQVTDSGPRDLFGTILGEFIKTSLERSEDFNNDMAMEAGWTYRNKSRVGDPSFGGEWVCP